jgi:gamma-glutamylcyclotransferase
MYYFAYASNLDRKQMLTRCPDCKPKFTAVLPNCKLIFTGWSREWHGGVASIKPMKGEKVAGGVYEISERDLRQLDKLKGYPAVYDRREFLVFSEDGEAVKAVAYLKKEQGEETRPSAEYVAAIRQGYRDWGIT